MSDKGYWAAICDRCGFRFRSDQLREEWTGLRVCDACWEPRHPQDMVKAPRAEQPLPWTRPYPTDDESNALTPDYSLYTIRYYDREDFNAATKDFSVDVGYVHGPVTLPSGITLTVNSSLTLRSGNTETVYSAGTYTGASSGW